MKILLFLCLLAVSPAAPDTTDDAVKLQIAKIAAIPNSVERLAAYDDLATKLGLTPNSQKQDISEGKWKISITTSPIDDSETVTATLDADDPIRTQIGQTTPTLIFRYKEGSIESYIDFSTFIDTEDVDATIRFGKESAQEQTWHISTDHEALFYPSDVPSFMIHLSKVDSFLIRVTPYDESPVTSSFSLTGMDHVIDAIHAALLKKAK